LIPSYCVGIEIEIDKADEEEQIDDEDFLASMITIGVDP